MTATTPTKNAHGQARRRAYKAGYEDARTKIRVDWNRLHAQIDSLQKQLGEAGEEIAKLRNKIRELEDD